MNSTVNVTGDILTSDIGDFRNEGGTFTLSTGILDNRGQTLQQNATTGSWLLGTNRTIRGGTIDQSDNVYLGFPYVDSNNTGALDGVTVRGDLVVSNLSGNAGVLIPNGIVMENGTIRVGAGAYLRIQNVLDNATIAFSNSSFGTIRAEYSNGAPVVFGPGLVISGGTARIDNGSSSVVIVNQGTVSANVAARSLRFNGIGNYTNEGLIEARNGGTAILDSSTTRLTNLSNGVLTGGRWAVYSGSTLNFASAQVQVLDAELLLSGSNSTCAAISALNQVNGSLTIDAGRNLSTAANLLNIGFIRVGRLSTLTVNGGYSQHSEAVLALDMGGATAPAYGRLAVMGSATLDGALEIAFVSGYTPQLGDSFALVTAQSVLGQFSDVQLPELPPGMMFSLEYGVTAVELHVIAP